MAEISKDRKTFFEEVGKVEGNYGWV